MADEPQWTVRKGQPEASWGDWVFAHAVLLTIGAVVGGVLGWCWPLILATDPFPAVVERDTFLEPVSETVEERALRREVGRAEDDVREAIRSEGRRELVEGTDERAWRRALIGGALGLIAAAGVGWASRRRRGRAISRAA